MFSVKGKALFSEGGWGEAWIHMFSVKGGYTCSQLRGKLCSQRGGGGGGGGAWIHLFSVKGDEPPLSHRWKTGCPPE